MGVGDREEIETRKERVLKSVNNLLILVRKPGQIRHKSLILVLS